ncbi:hypothetical protein JTB14_012507 [Gonioctena quinquepunctata]|nr:hypothetical protein JTB14_012507 [Gonioctena quinquepunctata]
MDPKLWKKFSKMGKKYCDEHTRYKVDKSTKENLIDYCTENNDEDIAKKEEEEGALYQRLYRLDQEDLRRREEKWKKEELEYNLREKIKKEEKRNKQKQKDIINKRAEQTPPENAAAKAPSEKSPYQIAMEEDRKIFEVKEAEHKRQLEIHRRTKELHNPPRSKSKESAVEEYFEHLSESAKEEWNEQQEPKERRNTPIQEESSLEDEYYNYLASSDDETSEDHIFSDGGTYMGRTITPRITREEIRSLEDQRSDIEIDNQQQGKNAVHISPIVIVKNQKKKNIEINEQQQEANVEEETPHIFPNVIIHNEPMDTLEEENSPVSEDINEKIPTTKKGKKNKKKEELPKRTEPPPIILDGKPLLKEKAIAELNKLCKRDVKVKIMSHRIVYSCLYAALPSLAMED